MFYKYLWVNGNLDVWNAASRRHHFQSLKDMVDQGKVDPNQPTNYVGGRFSEDTFHPNLDRITVDWSSGDFPTTDELKYLLHSHLDVDRESRYIARVLQDRIAATVEDSEPAYNNGFMKEPHKRLYPCAWGDDEKMLPKAKTALKDHVLNSLEEEGYPNADRWITFTVYGSGASYNWDEDGDFDLQMWVDTETYNAGSNSIMDPDDLLADVRRAVQKINFPSFKELGLDTPDCEGRMLIQFYAKPGKGTEDENLASKPYACYDMENDEWFQHPEPIEPTFYGEQFLLVMPKAEDIALQAEALLGELERNTVNWQFWSAMYEKWGDSRYDEQAEEAKKNAEQEKEGVQVLFKGVFGGRQVAYSPEGKGIKDERDIVQKLLEVWGIFQRLKHFARQELPWEEQELPEDNSEDNKGKDKKPKDAEKDNVSTSKLTIVPNLGISHKLTIAESKFEVKLSNWDEIMDKARRLKNSGQVFITNNSTQHVEGQVVGDHGTYNTQFDRMDPNSQAITTWNCTCPWGEVSWGRTRQWKKYEGRPCAHTLAMFWASKSQPPSDDGQQQLFQQTPENTLPAPAPGGPNLPQPAAPQAAPAGPQPIPAVAPGVAAPPAPPVSSEPLQPGDPKLGPLGIPGALSKLKVAEKSVYDQVKEVANKHKPDGGYGSVWFDPATKTVWWQSADWTSTEEREAAERDFLAIPGVEKIDGEAEAQPTQWMQLASFQNGDLVTARQPMWGIDRDNNAQMVPIGSKGEVLFSDDRETIVIFPLDSGQLEPHLVRVQDSTENFNKGKGKTPFVGIR